MPKITVVCFDIKAKPAGPRHFTVRYKDTDEKDIPGPSQQ